MAVAFRLILNFMLQTLRSIGLYLLAGFWIRQCIHEMNSAMNGLKETAIQKDIHATKIQGKNRHFHRNAVFTWQLGRAFKLVEDAKATDDRYKEVANHGSTHLNLWSKYQIGWKAIRLRKEMGELWRQLLHEEMPKEIGGAKFKILYKGKEGRSSTDDDEKEIKREAVLEKLWELLKEDSSVGLVGVHGMGGVGKTKLLHDLNKRFSERGHSFQPIMIQVTERMDILRIQQDIGRELKLSWNDEDEKTRSADILRSLTEEKHIIIFDDVWHKLPLSDIGIPNLEVYAYCCKVVFATRRSALCRAAEETIMLKCLSWDESWTLFEDIAGNQANSTPEIQNFAMKIVEECVGLPLALINTGRAMSSATSVSEWREAAWGMKHEPWNVSGMASNVLSVLRRSYDNLSSESLRICFVYFALYPKQTASSRNLLTENLIGEKIFRKFDSMAKVHEGIDRLIGQLQKQGLLDGMELHNMVRAMAVWVGMETNDWLALPDAGFTDAPEPVKWRSAKRISLIKNDIMKWPEEPDCPDLVTLLLRDSICSRSIPNGFFRFMLSLKVLDLSRSFLDNLPTSIGVLHQLEDLNVSNSNIQSLPKEMGDLRKLRFINLENCGRLKIVPRGVFGKLSMLRVVRMDQSYGGWGLAEDGAKIEELRGLEHLVELDITIEDMQALRTLRSRDFSRVHASTRSINLRFLKGTTALRIPQDLGDGMKNLHSLRISDCLDMEKLVFGGCGREGSIENLHCLDIERLKKVKIVWKGKGPLECFKKLGELKIRQCEQMDQLVGITDLVEEMSGPFAFPELHVLHLVKLPAMTSIFTGTLKFPSLRELWVDDCPSLAKLPLGAHSASSLSVIWGSRKWWENLDWGLGGDVLKSKLDALLIE